MSIANYFDLNALIHGRGKDGTDEILIHPAGKFAHPTTYKDKSNRSVEASHLPESLAGRVVREHWGVATALPIGRGNRKTARVDAGCSLGSGISLRSRAIGGRLTVICVECIHGAWISC